VFSIKTPELKRQTIVAAMYGTFEKNEAEARKFWLEVSRGGVEFEDNHPTSVLDAFLKSAIEDKRKTELKAVERLPRGKDHHVREVRYQEGPLCSCTLDHRDPKRPGSPSSRGFFAYNNDVLNFLDHAKQQKSRASACITGQLTDLPTLQKV